MRISTLLVLCTFLLSYSNSFSQHLPSQSFWQKPSLEDWLFPQSFLQKDIQAPSSLDALVPCDCVVEQGAVSAPISSLLGTTDPVTFYDYGGAAAASANTGLEADDIIRIFLYEDPTGDISLFFIMDNANNGTAGTANLDFECLPLGASVVVSDDAGEFTGSAPNIVANFSWAGCCTDGGVISGMGCGNTFDIYISNITHDILES